MVAGLLGAVGLFIATNIDDIIVLSLFFARGAGPTGEEQREHDDVVDIGGDKQTNRPQETSYHLPVPLSGGAPGHVTCRVNTWGILVGSQSGIQQ